MNAPAQPDLRLNFALAVRVLEGFIADAVATTGASGVVVGLSGGVDSALATALAVPALGVDRVHALFLPHGASSTGSKADAAAVAVDLGLELETIDITGLVNPYFDAAEPDADRLRRGNFMARVRMAVLFDHAKKHRALVLGTSNKSEILLGYSTIFGDNASSINPLGDLYKTQVLSLARDLGLPESVIAKPPTADLWPEQTDEGELGFSYALADEILYLMFDRGLTPDQVIERGYDTDIVERIRDLEARNRFKRRLMLIARLSGSAINLDREIPRD
jgi:NAD+ synthase